MSISYSKSLAVIDPQLCIGCTLCIKACPFDAILGANKQLHYVISAYCTGCKLCVAPCPVDCISMQANQALQHSTDSATELKQKKINFVQACKQRAKLREQRLAAEQEAQNISLAQQKQQVTETLRALKNKI